MIEPKEDRDLSQPTFAILWEDSHCLAVAKPAGLATVAPAEMPSLARNVGAYLEISRPIGIVHRLDGPVSGVCLWAKTERAARRLKASFAHREVGKRYWAIVEASPAISSLAPGTEWVDWLTPKPDHQGQIHVENQRSDQSREAKTQVVRSTPIGFPSVDDAIATPSPPIQAVLVELEPITGRTHQLRVQTSHRGMPICGDRRYGATASFAAGAIALHAHRLSFPHPSTGERVEILTEPPSPAWSQLIPSNWQRDPD